MTKPLRARSWGTTTICATAGACSTYRRRTRAGHARLFTHLFYEGTILSSKKQEYERACARGRGAAAMQQLHKAMIKELTHGEHDARIGAFFARAARPSRWATGLG